MEYRRGRVATAEVRRQTLRSPGSIMKRLLQQMETGLYYQGPGTWTNNPDFAQVFHRTSSAIECCMREGLPPVQLVLKFEDSAYDICLPCWPTGGIAALHGGVVGQGSNN
jgi:hypothetical protein